MTEGEAARQDVKTAMAEFLDRLRACTGASKEIGGKPLEVHRAGVTARLHRCLRLHRGGWDDKLTNEQVNMFARLHGQVDVYADNEPTDIEAATAKLFGRMNGCLDMYEDAPRTDSSRDQAELLDRLRQCLAFYGDGGAQEAVLESYVGYFSAVYEFLNSCARKGDCEGRLALPMLRFLAYLADKQDGRQTERVFDWDALYEQSDRKPGQSSIPKHVATVRGIAAAAVTIRATQTGEKISDSEATVGKMVRRHHPSAFRQKTGADEPASDANQVFYWRRDTNGSAPVPEEQSSAYDSAQETMQILLGRPGCANSTVEIDRLLELLIRSGGTPIL